MAIIKNPEDLSNATNYVATVAFFCCISCVTLMLRFGGFKATLFGGKNKKESSNIDTGLYITGAYRANRDEFYGNGRLSDPPKKLTPSMVRLPSSDGNVALVRSTKSVGDLSMPNSSQQIRQSAQNVSADPRAGDALDIRRNSQKANTNQDKEQKRQEKQRLSEQKGRERAAAKEQAKQEKNREKAKKDALKNTKNDKRKAPQPMTGNLIAQTASPQSDQGTSVRQTNVSYSTNTLESSISRSSGPPPYSERGQLDTEQNQSATTSNVTFGKSIGTSSWDQISEHREQLNRTTTTNSDNKKHKKQTLIDLNYNFTNTIKEERDNSEV